MRGIIPMILGVAMVLSSCELQRNENCDYGYTSGVVVYAGAPEVDGCGWLIETDSGTYHPVNLEKDFMIEGLPVLLRFLSDPEVFRCGRGGMEIPSIRITEIKMNAEPVRIMTDESQYKMDHFNMDSAYVKGDYLYLRVSYSGGCRDHELVLYKLKSGDRDPQKVELALSHDANGDMCEAWITRWLTFSLIPIRDRGKSEVQVWLRGSPEMSAYFMQFTYRY